MRPIASLLAVAASTAGLFLACGGGLGSPADNLLGNDPFPNSGDHPNSSTDPPGNSNDPIGTGTCVCPEGYWDCGQFNINIELKNGVCIAGGETTLDRCTGAYATDKGSGTVKKKGNGLEVCLGSQCLTCVAGKPPPPFDSGINDTGVKDTGVKDTSIPDAAKDVAKEAAAVCTSTCFGNTACQTTCPAAGSGNSNCCDLNANVCYVEPSTVCP